METTGGSNTNTQTNDPWAGRCCNAGDSNCLGGGNNGHEHGNPGGRGGPNGPAGAK